MGTPETREQVAVRRRHAEAELIHRGVLKKGFPPGLRLAMRMFPRLKSPYHGDHGRYALFFGALFALPFVVILGWLFHADGRYPAWIGVAIGVAGGALFGVILAGFQRSVARRLRLTPWEQLDNPAPTAIPDGAEDFAAVEEEFLRRMNRINNR